MTRRPKKREIPNPLRVQDPALHWQAIMRGLRGHFTCLALALAAILCPSAAGAHSQNYAIPSSSAQVRAARAYAAALKAGLPELRAFLVQFPKGSDLHMHLSGSVYAETFIHPRHRRRRLVHRYEGAELRQAAER